MSASSALAGIVTTVLIVIAPDQFRDEEYFEPRAVLEERGARIVTASVAPGPCRGKSGALATADVALVDTKAADYDAVVFVGGAGAAVFFDDRHAHELARSLASAGKTLGAICIGPSTLAHAGLLEGRRATAFPTQEDDLRDRGATYTGTPVEVDDGIVTANGPEAATAFGEALADRLGI